MIKFAPFQGADRTFLIG